MKKDSNSPWITSVKRSTLKAKVARHYKAHHDIVDMGLGPVDRAHIEWATQLIQDLYPAAVRDIPAK